MSVMRLHAQNTQSAWPFRFVKNQSFGAKVGPGRAPIGCSYYGSIIEAIARAR
jgi:hypothetical protein